MAGRLDCRWLRSKAVFISTKMMASCSRWQVWRRCYKKKDSLESMSTLGEVD